MNSVFIPKATIRGLSHYSGIMSFEIFHMGKAMLIPENLHGKKWIVALPAGFMARQNVRNVGKSETPYPGGMSATDSGSGPMVMCGWSPQKYLAAS